MDIFKIILEHLILSLAGLLIYSLIAVSQHLKVFSINKFWNENKPFWVWAFALQFIFAVIITVFPDSGTAIKTLSGIDLSEPMAFLTSGAVLAKVANWATGKTTGESNQIGKKPIQ